jgi:hypothetical protein
MKESEWMSFEKLCVLLSRLFTLPKDERFRWATRALGTVFVTYQCFSSMYFVSTKTSSNEKQTRSSSINPSVAARQKAITFIFLTAHVEKRNQLIPLSVTSSKVCFISEKPTGSREMCIETVSNTLIRAPV